MARGLPTPDSDDESTAFNGRPSKLWLFIALLGIAGLAVTTYLTSNALSHTEVGCSLSGCNTVLGSKWSKIFGIPVSAFGMATYAVIMLGALHAYQSPIDDLRGRRVVALTAAIGVLASIYLTTIELFVIKAACQYCITSAVLVVVVAVAVIVAARKEGTRWIQVLRRSD